MRIRVFSDLHLEVSPWIPREVNADVIVMAGDIHTKERGIEWALSEFKNRPILYVLGNHEYYQGSLGNTLAKIAAEKAGIIKPNVPVVIGECCDETREVFEAKAKAVNAPIVFAEDSK